MPRPPLPLPALDTIRVQVGLSPTEVARLDRRRGRIPRSRYLRERSGVSEPLDLRALTVQQPWATLLVQGRKPWENRPRDPGARPGWYAIHAGLTLHARLAWARDLAPDLDPSTCPRGAILGLVWLEPGVPLASVRSGREWAVGPICLPVSEAIALPEPIPCRGALGLWRVPPAVRAAIEEQVGPL